MARKSGLGFGAGINALIPELVVDENKVASEISIDLIVPNKNQPRKNFDKELLEQLAESIKQHGLVQPIVVVKEKDYYKIVAGERRFRACKMLGLETVPVIIKEYDDKEVAEIALIENLQREDLNPIEEANGYKRLIEEFNLTQEQVSEKIKKSRSAVTNSLRLLSLPDEILKMVEDKKLSMGHARAILGAVNEKRMLEVARLTVSEGLSVRQVEKLVKETPKKPPKKDVIDRDVKNAIEEFGKKLENKYQTKINVSYSNKFKGKIEINFSDYREMNRIFDLLK